MNSFESFIGKGNFVWFIGVVEDNVDPLTLGRCKVRCFGFHPADRTAVPTIDLPWSMVIQPTTSASTSGIGFSPNGLKPDSWVMGFFADGETAQFPIIIGTIPRIHRPSAPDSYIGNSGAGYFGPDSIHSGAPTPGNPDLIDMGFSQQSPINPTGGSTIKDDGSHLTKQNIPNWPLKVYKPSPSHDDYGLACKDRGESLKIHYATALALEELGRRFGTYAKISSAYRTPAYNASVRGAARSQHVAGRAFDIPYSSIGGSSHANLIRFAQRAVQCGFVGFGLYNSFIHIDTGSGRTWGGAKAAWFVNGIKQAGWYPTKPGLKDVRTHGAMTSNNQVDSTTTGSVAKEPTTKQEVRDYMDNYLKEDGYTPEQRAAILAHASHESGFDPGINQRPGSKRGTAAGGYGLFQWDDRRPALMSYAKRNGLNPALTSTQMKFFTHEMNTTEGDAARMLRSSTNLHEANLAMKQFERYQDIGGAETQQRLQTGKQFLGGDGNVGSGGITSGFCDPTCSLPHGDYQGKPSTHNTAAGLNATPNQPELIRNNDARLTGFPNAGDKGTIGEPALSESPQYPYNFTYASLSGHLWEYDDTPGVERVNFQHKSGSRLAIGAEGTTILKSQGNMYNVAAGDSYTLTMGGYKISAKDDIDMRSTSDITIHGDGTVNILVRNDSVEHISGKKDILVGETLQIKANRIIIEAENIDFVAHSNITMEAGGNISMRAGGTMATSAAATKIFTKGAFDADAGSLDWLSGNTKEIPEQTGKSTDLGAPPARAKIEKKPYIRRNSDNTPTLDDGMNVYSKSDPTQRTVEI